MRIPMQKRFEGGGGEGVTVGAGDGGEEATS